MWEMILSMDIRTIDAANCQWPWWRSWCTVVLVVASVFAVAAFAASTTDYARSLDY